MRFLFCFLFKGTPAFQTVQNIILQSLSTLRQASKTRGMTSAGSLPSANSTFIFSAMKFTVASFTPEAPDEILVDVFHHLSAVRALDFDLVALFHGSSSLIIK